ncbi:type I-E CRISPR-associated protein Cas6/Cse3/CasE [Methanoculleus sp. Wushi-C6]|uniref:Type I-E CRISPR-associated protein Cas6/Cse3/CasE n=1 Tax=Methanoculleus caldifontis TaxID=2651577 RepID=A0ABU3X2G6_9EURY|nr:type I-E CRISPR-associated protein Cas6/Cse3/CasE [Methanoculleus sp. Wushi-C6]MDV2482242.1 type I-E CRISPR-associated protein Cas6/Cse3/CasE [Methanoculleus sp. Wushi-C6]
MFLSRMRLRPGAAGNREFWQMVGSEYQAHHMVWDLFTDGPDRERDFLYRVEENEGMPTIYSVCEREPVNRGGMWTIETKLYDPALRTGQQLAFVLRANPVRTKCDEKGKHHRHDVVMEAKTRLKQQGRPREEWPPEPEIVQQAGFAWLAMKGEANGFSVAEGDVRADGYIQRRFRKRKGRHEISISTLDYTGILTVADPERFKAALYNGIGPAKGFGCGMMMVRPAVR